MMEAILREADGLGIKHKSLHISTKRVRTANPQERNRDGMQEGQGRKGLWLGRYCYRDNKNGRRTTTMLLHQLCNRIWTTGTWPDDWTESIYIPIHKKGAKDLCGNYRTITLINQTSKIMLYILQERLRPYLLPQISEEQAGFRPGRGTRDQLLNVRQMIEKFYEFNVPALMCFLDYSKAFDNVK